MTWTICFKLLILSQNTTSESELSSNRNRIEKTLVVRGGVGRVGEGGKTKRGDQPGDEEIISLGRLQRVL